MADRRNNRKKDQEKELEVIVVPADTLEECQRKQKEAISHIISCFNKKRLKLNNIPTRNLNKGF